MQDRVMFDLCCDDVVSFIFQCICNTHQSPVVSLCTSGSKEDFFKDVEDVVEVPQEEPKQFEQQVKIKQKKKAYQANNYA